MENMKAYFEDEDPEMAKMTGEAIRAAVRRMFYRVENMERLEMAYRGYLRTYETRFSEDARTRYPCTFTTKIEGALRVLEKRRRKLASVKVDTKVLETFQCQSLERAKIRMQMAALSKPAATAQEKEGGNVEKKVVSELVVGFGVYCIELSIGGGWGRVQGVVA